MDEKIQYVLDTFTLARKILLKLERILQKIDVRIKALLLIAWLICCSIAAMWNYEPIIIGSAVSFWLIFYLLAACKALHSCRSLLMFWLGYGAILALLAAALLTESMKLQNVGSYLLFLILYAALWLLLAGAADHEPTKIACSIINTFTTLLLIIINVLAIWGKASDISGIRSLPWGNMQDYTVVVLLPLVINGYLAALLKEVQVYWEKRHRQETEEA